MPTKTTAITLAIIAVAITAAAQTMEQRRYAATRKLTLNCVKSKAGGKKEITWQTDYGSNERSNNRSLSYDLHIRYNGPTPTNYTCQAYWIANAKEVGDFVIDTTYEPAALIPGKITKLSVTSPEINQDTGNYAALGIKTAYGANLKGLMLRIVDDTETANDFPLAVFTSSSQWSKYIWAGDPNAQFKFNPSADPAEELLEKQIE